MLISALQAQALVLAGGQKIHSGSKLNRKNLLQGKINLLKFQVLPSKSFTALPRDNCYKQMSHHVIEMITPLALRDKTCVITNCGSADSKGSSNCCWSTEPGLYLKMDQSNALAECSSVNLFPQRCTSTVCVDTSASPQKYREGKIKLDFSPVEQFKNRTAYFGLYSKWYNQKLLSVKVS